LCRAWLFLFSIGPVYFLLGSGGAVPPFASFRGFKSRALMFFLFFLCHIIPLSGFGLFVVCQFFYRYKRQSPTKVRIGFAKSVNPGAKR
jgi:hypothetical protein